MIHVIENAGQEIPAEIVACGEGAPAYLIIDPKQGTAEGRARVAEEIRAAYKKGSNIIFADVHVLDDGRIVSVGHKVDPLLGQLNLLGKPR